MTQWMTMLVVVFSGVVTGPGFGQLMRAERLDSLSGTAYVDASPCDYAVPNTDVVFQRRGLGPSGRLEPAGLLAPLDPVGRAAIVPQRAHPRGDR